MKILVDENMPYARELFSRLGDVQAIPGRPVPADALTDADALMVRSVTRVNEALLAGKAIKFVGTATAGTDHVDIGLHELAETTFLRAFATPDLLNLPTLERECQIAGMFDHITAQRNSQIEVQTKAVLNRSVGLMTDLLKAAQQVNFLAGFALLEQTRTLLNSTSFNANEAIELENFTERVDNTLLHNTFRGEPLWKS